MNWDQVGGKWKQLKGKAQTQWGKITDDRWTQIKGTREEIVGLVQENYGHAREKAEREVDDWMKTQS